VIGRWDAPESLVLELLAERPNAAVRRAAHDLAIWTETHDCTAPERMLRERVTWDRYQLQPGARPADHDPPPEYGQRSDADYAAFRFALLQRTLAGMGPLDVAAQLAEFRPHFAHLDHGRLGELLDAEIDQLRRSGPCWNPALAQQSLAPLALVPRPHAPQPQGALGGMS
jgi:hypothetical protein